MVCGLASLVIVIAGYYINPQVEENNSEREDISVWQNLKKNSIEIKEAMKIPVIYRTIGFFLLSGLTVPTFSDINYYFVLNVVKFSKFTVSMLSIVGYISLLGGVIMYNKWLKQWEIRTLLKYSLILGFFS
jgi:Na+/melibiose symporter-like transporter